MVALVYDGVMGRHRMPRATLGTDMTGSRWPLHNTAAFCDSLDCCCEAYLMELKHPIAVYTAGTNLEAHWCKRVLHL